MRKIVAVAALAGAFFASSAGATILTATNNTFGNFDASSGTRTFSLAGGTIADVNIWIDFAKCDDPSLNAGSTGCIGSGNSFNNEIVFRLTNPGGTTVNLVNAGTYANTGAAGARVQVNFDDAAATTVGGNLQSGSFRSVGSLAGFNGLGSGGIWTLFIQDTVGADPLSFFSARLEVRTVPEPTFLTLMGLGLLGIGFGALRRRKA